MILCRRNAVRQDVSVTLFSSFSVCQHLPALISDIRQGTLLPVACEGYMGCLSNPEIIVVDDLWSNQNFRAGY